MKLLALTWPRLLGACVLCALFAACGNQGEGDRCDKNNFNADCDDNLTCTQVSAMNFVCCTPGNPNAVAACVPQVQSGMGTTPRDGGADGAPDAATDGAAE